MQHAVDPDKDLVQVPRVPGFGLPPTEPSGEIRTCSATVRELDARDNQDARKPRLKT